MFHKEHKKRMGKTKKQHCQNFHKPLVRQNELTEHHMAFRNHNFPGIVKQLELNLLLIKSKSLPKLLHKLGIEDITI